MGKPLPRSMKINSERYLPVILKIHTKYENGVPEDLTLLPDDSCVELVGGEEFLIAYVPESMVKR